MSAERVYAALCELNDALREEGVDPTRMPSLHFWPEDAVRIKAVLREILVDRHMALAGFAMAVSDGSKA